MHLTKYIKSLQIIVYRQKCLNWCRISSNRRYFNSDDNKDSEKTNSEPNNDNKESVDKNELTIAEEKQNKAINARQKLSNLINEMKVETNVWKSDSIISKSMAKPKYFIRKSARNEEQIPPELEDIKDITEDIDKRLVVAAKAITKGLTPSEAKTTQTQLFQMIGSDAKQRFDAKQGKTRSVKDLDSVFLGMKVDKNASKPYGVKSRTIQSDEDQRQPKYSQISRLPPLPPHTRRPATHTRDRVNLYVSEPLGIFEADMKETSDAPKMSIWDRLMRDELERIVVQPPSNAFEEMIRWTEEGKLWKYPISNEQGLEEEENVPFYEHVLLDHLLEGFPEKGPVRQFMELVLIGLSSNPYITVERKHRTVDFYRQFFKDKEDILRASGALG